MPRAVSSDRKRSAVLKMVWTVGREAVATSADKSTPAFAFSRARASSERPSSAATRRGVLPLCRNEVCEV